jgi:hypothetical protein
MPILGVPLHRRLETAAALFVIAIPTILICLNILVIFFTTLLFLYILYLGWIIAIDVKSPVTGGRPTKWIRRLPVWARFRQFFPATLIRTTELDPSKTYMFGKSAVPIPTFLSCTFIHQATIHMESLAW